MAGFHVTLVSNGTLLTKDKIESLVDLRLDKLQVSLWASSPAEYKKNYPGTNPDTFWKVVDGLKLLTAFKAERQSRLPLVVLHQPINRHNFQNLGSAVDLALETGCNAISFAPFNSHRGKLRLYSLASEDERVLHESLNKIRRRLKSLPLSHNVDQTLLRYRIGEAVWEKLPCYIGWIDARVKVDGTILPCNPCNLPMGDLNKNSLHEIWNSQPYRYFRRQTLTRKGLSALCQKCECEFCCHVPANLRLHHFLKWLSPVIRLTDKGGLCSEH